jgi:hypothetical protein
MKLKLVAITKVYRNIGNEDAPMWKPIDVNEYIIAHLTKKPTWQNVGEHLEKFIHAFEGAIDGFHKEVYCGFELYEENALTHSEHFMLQSTGTIDFPAKDLTEIDVSDEIDGLQTS